MRRRGRKSVMTRWGRRALKSSFTVLGEGWREGAQGIIIYYCHKRSLKLPRKHHTVHPRLSEPHCTSCPKKSSG